MTTNELNQIKNFYLEDQFKPTFDEFYLKFISCLTENKFNIVILNIKNILDLPKLKFILTIYQIVASEILKGIDSILS